MMFWVYLTITIWLAYMAIARQTGFSIFVDADKNPRFSMPDGVKKLLSSSSGNEDGSDKGWWNNLDKESSPGKQFVTLVVALLLAYIEFSIRGSVWLALFLILMAAIIVPPKSTVTKVFVCLNLVIIITAALFPGAAEMRKASYNIADVWTRQKGAEMSKYAERLEKGPAISNKSTSVGNVPIKKIALTSDWSEPTYFNPSGGAIRFYCTSPGAKVRIDYTAVKSSVVAPGQEFDCATPGVTKGDIHIAKEAGMDTRFYFKSDEDSKGVVIIENGV